MDIDTSSYPKLPTQQQNPLDTIAKVQGIQKGQQELQSGALGIDRQKLELVNQKWDMISKRLGGQLNNPDLNANTLVDTYQELLKDKLIDPEQAAKEMTNIPLKGKMSDSEYQNVLKQNLAGQLLKHASVMEQLNWYAGVQGPTVNTGEGQYTTNYNQRTGQTIPTGRFQNEPGPTQPVIPPKTPQNPNPAPSILGGQPAPSTAFTPYNGGKPALPIQAGPNMGTAVPQNSGGRVDQSFGDMQRKPPIQTGYPPGQAQAAEATGRQSGEMLARDRDAVSNYQQRVLPLEKGIQALETLGTKGSGPGTEAFNDIKSFILSNVPGVTEEMMSSVKNFDEAKKYFTQYVNENGNSGTNDKLAAAFSGNPSTGISNAAAKDVAKTALSLARMKVAMNQEFERSGLSDDQYGRWLAKNFNKYDPRAFGVNMLSKEAGAKLRKDLEKNPKEMAKFRQSLDIAEDLGLVK